MSGYGVDASVAVKRVVEEVFSDEAGSLLDSVARLVAPELLFAGDITQADFADAVDVLRAAPVSE